MEFQAEMGSKGKDIGEVVHVPQSRTSCRRKRSCSTSPVAAEVKAANA
jgi:hypothetical protein